MTQVRFAHVMLRVLDLQASLQFYQQGFGLREIRRKDYPKGKFTLVFLGYEGDESEQTAIELTHNWEQQGSYQQGQAFGHLAFVVDNLEQAYQQALEAGGKSKVEPKQFSETTRLAFVLDPDGYSVELIQSTSKAPG